MQPTEQDIEYAGPYRDPEMPPSWLVPFVIVMGGLVLFGLGFILGLAVGQVAEL